MSFRYPYVLVYVLLGITLVALGYVLYIKLRAPRYTRERYAFAALAATVSLVTLGITTLTVQSPWEMLARAVSVVAGKPALAESPSLLEQLLVVFLIVFAITKIYQAFDQWNGQVSLDQYHRERLHETRSMVTEGLEEFWHLVQRKGPRPLYESPPFSFKGTALEAPRDTLVWRDHARDLLVLKWPGTYQFDPDHDWHDRASCWIGSNARTGALAALWCTRNFPPERDIANFVQYVEHLPARASSYDLILAIQDEAFDTEIEYAGRQITVETEASLLDGLVDFTDYFRDIKRRVEIDTLPDSDFTIADLYVPSELQIETADGVWQDVPENLEEYLCNWMQEPGQRQLALLGEYGQGKSTGALLFTYQAIQRQSLDRLPLLIELRGKSPSTLQPMELLGVWASVYQIKPQALMKLLLAGRVLLIFEGFDEMAYVGDAEARMEHFRSLWRFCYPKVKILITGRPNLFLDDRELKADLGIAGSTATGPYCQALRLKPFTSGQMAQSLRWTTAEVREQIVAMAADNDNFRGIVERPSLLYIVGRLWESPVLVAKRTNINSAMVIKLFIEHSYQRQTEKHRDNRRFMVLTEVERSYFLDGIAAYMAAHDLPNQITRRQFDEAIANLYRALPDELSTTPSNALREQETRPLKLRLQDHEEPLESIKTDVRTYGILIQDPSRQNALRFPHKSFFEYLFAQYVSQYLVGADRVRSAAIQSATEAVPEKIIDSSESLSFAGEIISEASATFEDSKNNDVFDDLFKNLVYKRRNFRKIFLYFSVLLFSKDTNKSLVLILILMFIIILPLPKSLSSLSSFLFPLLSLSLLLLLLSPLSLIISLLMNRSFKSKKRVVLWILIIINLGVTKEQFEQIYGKLITKGLINLIRDYDAEHILNKFAKTGWS